MPDRGTVNDPQFALFSGATQIDANDNWGGTNRPAAAFTQVGAFQLPATSRDAALLATLQPGNYTVQVGGVGGTTGTALVEIYEVPQATTSRGHGTAPPRAGRSLRNRTMHCVDHLRTPRLRAILPPTPT